jgi:hypothetical protein
MQKTYWRIDGYDSTTRIFREIIPCTHITDAELTALLRALVAKYGQLTDKEVIGSYLRRNVKGHQRHLEVTRPANLPSSIMCGSNPHFIATACTA